MNDSEFVNSLKREILNDLYNRYFNTLNTFSVSGGDERWNDSKELYSHLNEKQRQELKSFVRLIMTDTLSNVFAKLDNVSSFANQEGFFELTLNGKIISGDLQEIFLMQIEEDNEAHNNHLNC